MDPARGEKDPVDLPAPTMARVEQQMKRILRPLSRRTALGGLVALPAFLSRAMAEEASTVSSSFTKAAAPITSADQALSVDGFRSAGARRVAASAFRCTSPPAWTTIARWCATTKPSRTTRSARDASTMCARLVLSTIGVRRHLGQPYLPVGGLVDARLPRPKQRWPWRASPAAVPFT